MLDERQILTIIAEELVQAAGGNENDFIEHNRKAALATYLGQKNGKEVEGRSTVVSTDVADAIEWIMPEIVKAFTQNNEVVTFDPCGDGDELQAELESQFVYDILMKENNGFLVIHQFIKDALMQKNGFIKCFYSNEDKETIEHYTGLTQIEYQMVIGRDDMDVMAETMNAPAPEQEMPTFDIKVKRTLKEGKINVISVPPEEFRVNKMHPSVDVSTARFSAHVMLKHASDLVEEGYDKAFIDTIPTAQVYEDDREYRFYMQDETVYPDRDIGSDPSLRTLEISECYMHLDLDEDGIAEFVKVTVAGGDNPDVLLDVEPIDSNPFISSTAILMSHKLFGLSIYDRLKDIQEQKTSLWRNILDNMYLQNNQRTIAVENQVNLDDLMVSRPGGIIRVKRPDALQPFPTPTLSPDSYKMMDYLDQVRAGRAGVSPEGPVTDSMIGDRVGSEGVERMMSQKEELVGLMIRVIAETGIKPLCYKIRELAVKHKDAVDYKFRGQWVKVDPSRWRSRTNTTVRVGTGSGNRKEQQNTLMAVAQMQEKILALPGQILVTPNQVYNLASDFAKLGGLGGVGKYMLDPQSPEGQQNAQQVQQQMQQQQDEERQKEGMLLKAQADVAQAAVREANAKMETARYKQQLEQIQLVSDAEEKAHKAQMDHLKQRLEEAEAVIESVANDEELEFRYWDRREYYEVERQRIAAQERMDKENGDDDGREDSNTSDA